MTMLVADSIDIVLMNVGMVSFHLPVTLCISFPGTALLLN